MKRTDRYEPTSLHIISFVATGTDEILHQIMATQMTVRLFDHELSAIRLGIGLAIRMNCPFKFSCVNVKYYMRIHSNRGPGLSFTILELASCNSSPDTCMQLDHLPVSYKFHT